MCIRTKTSYGCGHTSRVRSDCRSSDCPGPHKYHYVKGGDCRECRVDYSQPRREPDTPIRSAQKRRSSARGKTPMSSTETFQTEQYDVSGGASPWMPQKRTEKTSWESPHRKRADEAWLSEHDDRIVDLSERIVKTKISGGHLRPKYPKQVVSGSPDHDHHSYDRDDSDHVRSTPIKKSHADVRRRLEDRVDRSHSKHGEDRQYSHDSLPDSMPSYRSSPKMRKSATFVNSHPDTRHDYDYYNSPSSPLTPKQHKRPHQGHGRSRSDTYHSRSKSYGYESDYEVAPIPPIQGPPLTTTGYDTYEYYASIASPSGVPYTYPDHPYNASPRPQHYVTYQTY